MSSLRIPEIDIITVSTNNPLIPLEQNAVTLNPRENSICYTMTRPAVSASAHSDPCYDVPLEQHPCINVSMYQCIFLFLLSHDRDMSKPLLLCRFSSRRHNHKPSILYAKCLSSSNRPLIHFLVFDHGVVFTQCVRTMKPSTCSQRIQVPLNQQSVPHGTVTTPGDLPLEPPCIASCRVISPWRYHVFSVAYEPKAQP